MERVLMIGVPFAQLTELKKSNSREQKYNPARVQTSNHSSHSIVLSIGKSASFMYDISEGMHEDVDEETIEGMSLADLYGVLARGEQLARESFVLLLCSQTGDKTFSCWLRENDLHICWCKEEEDYYIGRLVDRSDGKLVFLMREIQIIANEVEEILRRCDTGGLITMLFVDKPADQEEKV